MADHQFCAEELERKEARIRELEAALREACELFNRDLAAYKSEAPAVTQEIEAFLDRYEPETKEESGVTESPDGTQIGRWKLGFPE